MDFEKFMELIELSHDTSGTDWTFNRRLLRLKLRWLIECEVLKLHKPIVSVPLPDDEQAFDAVTRLRKELEGTHVDVDFADVNSWLMGVNWCKDFIKGNAR